MVFSAFGCRRDLEVWADAFAVEPSELRSTGRNPYFILEPGYQLVLADGNDTLVVTVLDQTRIVGGIETRVVEERETENGTLVEISRNFFAVSARTNDVYYFGEDVDIYRDGVIASHEGRWLAGADSARFGLMMPGQPLVGARYYQEIAPGVAMDRARIMSTAGLLTTPAGAFRHVLQTEETTPLETGEREFKFYAPGVGLIRDGSLTLVRFGARP